jgi:hypothetical protein
MERLENGSKIAAALVVLQLRRTFLNHAIQRGDYIVRRLPIPES